MSAWRVRIKKADLERIDNIRLAIARERKEIKTKIDTITHILDVYEHAYRISTQLVHIPTVISDTDFFADEKTNDSLDDE